MVKKKFNTEWYLRFIGLMQSFTMASICALTWLVTHPNKKVDIDPTLPVVAEHISITTYAPRDNLTATLRKERPGLDAAVSRDMIHLLGKRVYISCDDESLGVREIVDVMHQDKRGMIDLMVPDTKAAKKFGVRNMCKVQAIN